VHAAPDPAWTADGHVSDRWLPASPVTGHLDAFEWRVPLTGIAGAAAVIEPEAPPAIWPSAPIAPVQDHVNVQPPAPPPTDGASALARLRRKADQPKAEPIIPLVHAPDDPGPEVVVDEETEQEREQETKASGWRKLFG